MARLRDLDIIEAVRDAGEEGITAKELHEKYFSDFTLVSVQQHLKALVEKNPSNIVRYIGQTKHGAVYTYYFKPIVDDELCSDSTNEEGYKDPTASAAIAYADESSWITTGNIFKVKDCAVSWFLVVRHYEDTILGYPVEITPIESKSKYAVCWPSGSGYFCTVYFHRIDTIQERKFLKNVAPMPCGKDTFQKIIANSPLTNLKEISYVERATVDEQKIVKDTIEQCSTDISESLRNEIASDADWGTVLHTVSELWKERNTIKADLSSATEEIKVLREKAKSWYDKCQTLSVEKNLLEERVKAHDETEYALLRKELDVFKYCFDRVTQKS